MSSDRELTRTVQLWLQDREDVLPERVLDEVLDLVHTTPQDLPFWRAWRTELMGNTLKLAAAAVAVLAAAGIGFAIYFSRPAISPASTPLPSPTVAANETPGPSPTSSPFGTPMPTPQLNEPTGLVVYEKVTRIANGIEGACVTPSFGGCTQWSSVFVVNSDGSEPRELTPGAWIAKPSALSPDGTRLIVEASFGRGEFELGKYVTDLDGSGLRLLETGCSTGCLGDSGFAFSPDGERLAFIRSFGISEPNFQATDSVVAIMDWSTGEVVELESTRVRDRSSEDPCLEGCTLGVNEPPRWSPDGSRLIFTRSDIPNPDDRNVLNTVTFVVDDDGGNLRQLVDTELFARDARWSPDGLIVFTSAIESVTGRPNFWHQLNDIYTVLPDGTGLTRLTTFTVGQNPSGAGQIGALRPNWTSEGRIVFLNIPIPPGDESVVDLWVMNGDGSNAQELDASDVTMLTSIGCAECPYPPFRDLASQSTAIWGPRP